MGVLPVCSTILLSYMLCLSAGAETPGPVVKSKQGDLRGLYLSVKGLDAEVQAYMGIPFAKPPVGPLRLANPEPAEGWEGVRDATKPSLICIQNKQFLEMLMDAVGISVELPDISEDCLYLNVYAPAGAAPGGNLPVMVWIHGGGFTGGAATSYDLSAMTGYQDVVTVSIQYRLGLLGFLSSGDDTIPGNLGLLDQVEALRWVQNNIRDFGGDPGLVTIFGESAGGISVSLLTISPLGSGLFQRAIAESGTAALELLVTDHSETQLQGIADRLGCNRSPEKFATCLRNMDIGVLTAFSSDPTLRFPVVVDGVFLMDKVNKLYKEKKVIKIPFMTGVNNDEGGWMLPSFLSPPNWTEGIDREQFITIIGMFHPEPKDKPVLDLLLEEYVGNTEDRNEIRKGLTTLLGDSLFLIPAIHTANSHRDAGAPVYLYQYKYAPQYLRAKRASFVGADHGDELLMVLGFCFSTTHLQLSGLCNEEEMKLSKLMMSYWGNFARTGSPNGPGLVAWPEYGPTEEYLSIDMEQEVLQHLARDRFIYMTQTLPEKAAAAQKGNKRHPEL